MKIKEAIEKSFIPEIWAAYQKDHILSPPQLLEKAAIECFLRPQGKEPGVIEAIRWGLLHLQLTGLMPKD